MFFILLLSLFAITDSDLVYRTTATENNTSLWTDIIEFIELKNFSPTTTITCNPETSPCETVVRTLSTNEIPLILQTVNHTEIVFAKLNILFFHSDADVRSFIRRNLTWMADFHYIIFLKTRQAESILKFLWDNYKLCRTILFSSHRTGLIYDIMLKQLKPANLTRNLFKFRNFHGTPLRVTLFHRVPEVIQLKETYSGVNYNLLSLISTKLNFTPLIQDSTDKRKFGDYINGTYTGGFGDIVYHRSDIAFNGYFLKSTPDNSYKHLFPFTLDYVCFVVPKAGIIPKYLVPFKCLPLDVWIFIAISYVAVSLTRYWFYHLYKKFSVSLPNSNTFLTTLSATINFPLSISEYRYTACKVILMIYLSQMYVIVTSLQASLLTLLSIPMHYQDIDTLEELNNSQLTVQTSSQSMINVFQQDPRLRGILQRTQKTNTDHFRYLNFSFFARFVYHKMDVFKNFVVKKGNTTFEVHRISECPIQYYTTHIVHRNFPFVDEFNQLVARIVEAGIILKWDTDMMPKVMKYFQPVKLPRENVHLQIKTFIREDVGVAFFILTNGLFFCFCVFLCEIIYDRLKK